MNNDIKHQILNLQTFMYHMYAVFILGSQTVVAALSLSGMNNHNRDTK